MCKVRVEITHAAWEALDAYNRRVSHRPMSRKGATFQGGCVQLNLSDDIFDGLMSAAFEGETPSDTILRITSGIQ